MRSTDPAAPRQRNIRLTDQEWQAVREFVRSIRVGGGWTILDGHLHRPDGSRCEHSDPITADEVEAILGIPPETTLFYNKGGLVPAGSILTELQRRREAARG